MHDARLAVKPFRISAPFVLATLALAFVTLTSPAEAQTPVNIANFDHTTGGLSNPMPPGVITQGGRGISTPPPTPDGANSNGDLRRQPRGSAHHNLQFSGQRRQFLPVRCDAGE
jgi:hypothetical protein